MCYRTEIKLSINQNLHTHSKISSYLQFLSKSRTLCFGNFWCKKRKFVEKRNILIPALLFWMMDLFIFYNGVGYKQLWLGQNCMKMPFVISFSKVWPIPKPIILPNHLNTVCRTSKVHIDWHILLTSEG